MFRVYRIVKSKAFLLLALVFIFMFMLMGYKGYRYGRQLWNQPVLEKSILFTLHRGERLSDVFDHLVHMTHQQRLAVKVWIKFHPKIAQIRAGTYQLSSGFSFSDIAAKFRSGDVYQYRLTLVEGLTFSQWWQILLTAPGMKQPTTPPIQIAKQLGVGSGSLEGLLLPDTYYYTHGSLPEDIIRRAYHAMQHELMQVWSSREKGLPIKTPYQLLILASMIEKETGLKKEMPIVASVFVNRLRRHMRLQSDPTVIYGLGTKYNGDLTWADLKSKTTFNTYVIRGLPPTPIAMPSKFALEAAAHPVRTGFYYFVANGTGGHHFSKTLKAHNLAVRKYILKR